MFDLRSKYAFDATEGQIPEGFASVYGPANSHANCVPASFTAALNLLGLGDIDPQRLTNEIYGPNYRGGFGNFSKAIAWIQANVPNAPSMTDGPFDFAAAEAAGAAGQLVIVAGWINAASVTFTAQSNANGFSHASLLVAHFAGGKWVIWNTWTGQLQTYDQAMLGTSLYEMSVMTPGVHGPGGGNIPNQQESDMKVIAHDGSPARWITNGLTKRGLANPTEEQQMEALCGQTAGAPLILQQSAVDAIPDISSGVAVDLSPVLAAIAAIPAGTVNLQPVLDAIAALPKPPTTLTGKLA